MIAEGSAAMQRGDLTAAEKSFTHAIEDAPTRADAHFGLGLVQLREGAIDPAIASLQRAVKYNSKLVGAHMFLGITQYQAGQTEPALQNLSAEVSLNPNDVEALTWLGTVALESNHPEMAATSFDHASGLKPNDPLLLYYDGRAHSQVAAAVMARLYTLDPGSALVHRALAETYAESRQPEKSIAEYQLAIAKQPGDTQLLEALAEQQQRLSRFEDAVKTYQAELITDPHSAVAYYNLGKMDVERGHPEAGVVSLQKAAALHALPGPTDYYLGYGFALLGRNEEAAHWLEQSLASQPPPFIEESACFQLARVYQHLGRKEEAQHLLARVKQLKATESRQNEPMEGQPEANIIVRP